MNELKQWSLCIIIGAIAGTFAMAISPRGTMNKAVRAVTGIFIVASMCAPLMNLVESDMAINTFDYVYKEDGTENMDEYIKESFSKEIEKHILSVAETYKIEVKEIFINADIDADKCIIIHKISVSTASASDEVLLKFSRTLSEETGVNVAVKPG